MENERSPARFLNNKRAYAHITKRVRLLTATLYNFMTLMSMTSSWNTSRTALFRQKSELFGTGHPFYLCFPRSRFCIGFIVFRASESDRATDFGIVRTSFCMIVLMEATLDIIRRAYIKCSVRATKNVDIPHRIYLRSSANFCWTFSSFGLMTSSQ